MTKTNWFDLAVKTLFDFYTERLKNTNTDWDLMLTCENEILDSDYDEVSSKTLENGNTELHVVKIVKISKDQSKSGHTESIEIEKIEIWSSDDEYSDVLHLIYEEYKLGLHLHDNSI